MIPDDEPSPSQRDRWPEILEHLLTPRTQDEQAAIDAWGDSLIESTRTDERGLSAYDAEIMALIADDDAPEETKPDA